MPCSPCCSRRTLHLNPDLNPVLNPDHNPSLAKPHSRVRRQTMINVESEPTSTGTLTLRTKASRTHLVQLRISNLGIRILSSGECDLCEHRVYLKESSCTFCGLRGHRLCLKTSIIIKCPGHEITNYRPQEPIFGQDLEHLRVIVPLLVWKCISELDSRSPRTNRGLYELEGEHADMKRTVRAFEVAPDFVDLSDVPSLVIGQVLKRYLYETVDPLLQVTLRPQYMDISSRLANDDLTKSSRIKLVYELSKLLCKLPAVNKSTICYLCHHFKTLSDHFDETLMSPETLGRIFAPLFFATARRRTRIRRISDSANDAIHEALVAQVFIENVDALFGPPPSLRCIVFFDASKSNVPTRKMTY